MQIPAISLSIVIPTFNAGEEFSRMLNQLRIQENYSDAELVVLDSGSTDGTSETAKQFGAKVIPIDPKEFNHGLTRNLGIAHASGKWNVLLTQDAFPADRWFLQNFVNAVERENAAGGYARQIPRKDATPLVRRDVGNWVTSLLEARVISLHQYPNFFAAHPMEKLVTCAFDNVASIIRRDVWEKIPIPPAAFAEDLEWGYRALCNGYKIIYEPKAAVIHSHERSASYQYKRTFQNHYRLYELFRLRTIPSRWKVFRSIFLTMGNDWMYLLRSRKLSWKIIKCFLNVPRFAWASAWGQYHGAKTAAMGYPIHQMRDV